MRKSRGSAGAPAGTAARLDHIDRRLLETLWENGRSTWAELGSLVGLSAPAAAERVRRLEADRVIRGYTALVDGPAVGVGLTAFIEVTIEKPAHRKPFLGRVAALAEVQECHHIAGDYDYLLKVRCRDTSDLEQIVSGKVKSLPGIARTRTTIVLASPKESASLPLPGEPSASKRRRPVRTQGSDDV